MVRSVQVKVKSRSGKGQVKVNSGQVRSDQMKVWGRSDLVSCMSGQCQVKVLSRSGKFKIRKVRSD